MKTTYYVDLRQKHKISAKGAMKGIALGFLTFTTLFWLDFYDRNDNQVPEQLKLDKVEAATAMVSEDTAFPREVKAMTIKDKAGKFMTKWVEPYAANIEKALLERGYQDNTELIQLMCYVGEHESHFTPTTVSSFNIAGEHPTGVFQFLPSTFKSVSNGDIFNVDDQINAFITMWERNRLGEYQVLWKGYCNWEPCLTKYGL